MNAAPSVTGLLLAAGSARRFGADKLLARLPDGRSVLETTACHLAGAVDEVLGVVPAADHPRAAVLAALGIRSVACADAARGMAHSLRRGVAATAPRAGWLVVLGDMPFVTTATFARLAGALRAGARVVVPVHDGLDGQPVGFAAGQRAALLALSGDRGARAVLEAAGDAVRRIAVTDSGIRRDIDHPDDLPAGSAGVEQRDG